MTRTTHHNPNYDFQREGKGNFAQSYHLEMISDTERVSRFKRGIDQVVTPDSIFCELGCGTGIFSIYAATKAKKVYAVEYDPNILAFARHNIEKAGLSHKIELIHGDALQVELPETVDIVFSETLSIWMIEEPQVLVMNHAANNLLKPDGVIIPHKVINLAELCQTDFTFDDISLKTSIAQFTGIKAPRIMTESKVFNSFTFAFGQKNPKAINGNISMELLTPGLVNSVRLSSIVNIANGINFYSTDTLMPLTIVPLKEEVLVDKEGEKLLLQANYEHQGGLDNAVFQIGK